MKSLLVRAEKLRAEALLLWKEMTAEEHDAFHKTAPTRERAAPARPRTGVHGDLFEDDGTMITVDESEDQRLWIRVGPVFHGSKMHKQPGIWIEYQEKSMQSNLRGPVLLSPSVWRRLNKAVERKITEWRR
jgi:hypothetical protein